MKSFLKHARHVFYHWAIGSLYFPFSTFNFEIAPNSFAQARLELCDLPAPGSQPCTRPSSVHFTVHLYHAYNVSYQASQKCHRIRGPDLNQELQPSPCFLGGGWSWEVELSENLIFPPVEWDRLGVVREVDPPLWAFPLLPNIAGLSQCQDLLLSRKHMTNSSKEDFIFISIIQYTPNNMVQT